MAATQTPIPPAIILLAEAEMRGLPKYFTGKPCLHGHVAGRLTKARRCEVCSIIQSRLFRQRHPDQVKKSKRLTYLKTRESQKKRRERYRERELLYARNYRKKFPEKRAAIQRNREAKKRNGGKHSTEDILGILLQQKGKCAFCKISLKKTKPHVDHIVPISRGGSNARRNLQILCYKCNTSKRDKDPIDFARWTGRLL